ncbi:MAG: UDP-N-acetylmuramoyl-L-alanyl-D-glutamate--2,6-diaminopimelate ligase [Oscillospiraceae bacterium]
MKIYSINSYVEALDEAKLLISSKIINDTLAIETITYNSKETKPYTLFACKGAAFKKEYLDDAVDNSIACYLSEKIYDTNVPVSYIIVSDIRKAMALIADMYSDKAYNKLKLIGITGTKGKSTTAYYIKYIIDEYMQNISQKPCGIVSSIDTYDGKIMEESHLTTPEAFELHKHFDNAISSGLEYFVMEVSSQALKYDRVLGVDFNIGVFLNISEDHISPIEHSNFDDYFGSKLKLFNQTKTAIVNLDSDHPNTLLECAKASQKVITFGKDESADVYGYNIKKVGHETHFMVRTKEFDEEFILTMPGLFNVENALATIAVAMEYQIPVAFIKLGLFKARSSGRMEIFTSEDNSVVVIVDYAHNKLSFEKLYQSTLEEYKGRSIITVFGCPGGKAYNRRVELGELAGEYSDKVYLTMEDPAYEQVSDISLDIQKHVLNHTCECFIIDDRGDAIKSAILDAPRNSIVLITGKGNETRQKIGCEYIPCKTDIEYAQTYLHELAKKR